MSRRPDSKPAASAARAGLFGLLGLFLVSGACGLVHEVAWTRLLRRVLGNTTDSVTIVLCVFMGGLAIGSLLFGRVLLRRSPPLLTFAALEALVGLYCLALPSLVSAGAPLYGALYAGSTSDAAFVAARLSFAALVLLVPAVLMGGTLPVLARYVSRQGADLGRAAGTLYGANTLGAVLGASSGAFLFVPLFGVSGAIRAAAVANLLVAALALLLHRRAPRPEDGPPEEGRPADATAGASPSSTPARARTVVLLGYAVSGAAALAYEVGWTRALSLLVGSSVYAFGLMLTAFVLGLAAGSLVAARFADRVRRPFVVLAALQGGIALCGLVVVPLLDALPFRVTGWLSAARDSFWAVQGVTFLLFLLVMLLPTLLMGAMFPLASRVAGAGGARGADAGATVGTVYAANTVGAIAGAALAGFVLIPSLGVRGALLAAVVTNLLVGALFAEAAGTAFPRRRAVAGATVLLGVVLVLVVPGWDPSRTATGAFANARRLPPSVAGSPELLARHARQAEIVFHEDGRDTTVTVLERPGGERILSVNGKPDASSEEDLSTQLLLGHVPMLLHEDPDDVLVIGLASGITLAAVAKHDAETLDCAEIAPSVVRACRMFDEANDHVLDDERVRILVADGRNHLRFTERTYDVVVSEPSNPWIAGIGDLFTLEFFRIVRDRLNDGGVACIWVETYNIDEESLRSVARTFLEVFPGASLWNIGPFDFELIGVKGEMSIDALALADRAAADPVGKDLLRIGIDSVAELLARQVMGKDALRTFADGAPLHTDDNALLEFRAPRILFSNRRELELLETLEAARNPSFSWLAGADAAELEAAAERASEAEGRRRGAEIHLLRAAKLSAEGTPDAAERVRDELRRAVELDPDHPDVVRQLEEGMRQASAYEQEGRTAEAITTYRRLIGVFPAHPGPANDLAWILATHPNERFRNGDEAVLWAEKAVALAGEASSNELDTLAAAYAEAGRFAEARAAIARAVAKAEAEGNARAKAAFEAHEAAIRRGEPVRVETP